MKIHHRRFRVRRAVRAAGAASAALAASLCLSGCGVNGGPIAPSSGFAPARTGGAVVTLTEAPGHFLKYLVTVVDVTLTRSDGTVVRTVPAVMQLDLAQPVNLGTTIDTLEIPRGRYVSAAITVDFSNATIVVDNGAGGLIVAPTQLIDAARHLPVTVSNTQSTVALKLPAHAPLEVRANGTPGPEVTFNLAAANIVAPATIDATTAASRVRVTVMPVLTARLVPDSVT